MIIKQVPEDFQVTEIARPTLSDGPYILFELTKRNITTEDAALLLAKSLGIPRRSVSYAGTKDARAVTKQYMTAKTNRLDSFHHPDISITEIGTCAEPLSLGMLDGNEFVIVCRKLRSERLYELHSVPNYFDEQRFSNVNAEVGMNLIKKKFDTATALLNKDSGRAFLHDHLQDRGNDHVGALRKLPKNVLLMYVHAFQSLLYNELLRGYIRSKDPSAIALEGKVPLVIPTREIPNAEIPLIGFDSELSAEHCKLLERYGLSSRDFIVKQIPFLTVAGTNRQAFVELKNLKVSAREPDDRNPGYEKQKLSFYLPKGSYATIAIKCMYRTGRIT